MRQYDFQIPILFHVLQSMTITRLTACFVWPNAKSKCRAPDADEEVSLLMGPPLQPQQIPRDCNLHAGTFLIPGW